MAETTAEGAKTLRDEIVAKLGRKSITKTSLRSVTAPELRLYYERLGEKHEGKNKDALIVELLSWLDRPMTAEEPVASIVSRSPTVPASSTHTSDPGKPRWPTQKSKTPKGALQESSVSVAKATDSEHGSLVKSAIAGSGAEHASPPEAANHGADSPSTREDVAPQTDDQGAPQRPSLRGNDHDVSSPAPKTRLADPILQQSPNVAAREGFHVADSNGVSPQEPATTRPEKREDSQGPDAHADDTRFAGLGGIPSGVRSCVDTTQAPNGVLDGRETPAAPPDTPTPGPGPNAASTHMHEPAAVKTLQMQAPSESPGSDLRSTDPGLHEADRTVSSNAAAGSPQHSAQDAQPTLSEHDQPPGDDKVESDVHGQTNGVVDADAQYDADGVAMRRPQAAKDVNGAVGHAHGHASDSTAHRHVEQAGGATVDEHEAALEDAEEYLEEEYDEDVQDFDERDNEMDAPSRGNDHSQKQAEQDPAEQGEPHTPRAAQLPAEEDGPERQPASPGDDSDAEAMQQDDQMAHDDDGFAPASVQESPQVVDEGRQDVPVDNGLDAAEAPLAAAEAPLAAANAQTPQGAGSPRSVVELDSASPPRAAEAAPDPVDAVPDPASERPRQVTKRGRGDARGDLRSDARGVSDGDDREPTERARVRRHSHDGRNSEPDRSGQTGRHERDLRDPGRGRDRDGYGRPDGQDRGNAGDGEGSRATARDRDDARRSDHPAERSNGMGDRHRPVYERSRDGRVRDVRPGRSDRDLRAPRDDRSAPAGVDNRPERGRSGPDDRRGGRGVQDNRDVRTEGRAEERTSGDRGEWAARHGRDERERDAVGRHGDVSRDADGHDRQLPSPPRRQDKRAAREGSTPTAATKRQKVDDAPNSGGQRSDDSRHERPKPKPVVWDDSIEADARQPRRGLFDHLKDGVTPEPANHRVRAYYGPTLRITSPSEMVLARRPSKMLKREVESLTERISLESCSGLPSVQTCEPALRTAFAPSEVSPPQRFVTPRGALKYADAPDYQKHNAHLHVNVTDLTRGFSTWHGTHAIKRFIIDPCEWDQRYANGVARIDAAMRNHGRDWDLKWLRDYTERGVRATCVRQFLEQNPNIESVPKINYWRHFMSLCKSKMKEYKEYKKPYVKSPAEADYEWGCSRMVACSSRTTFAMLRAMRREAIFDVLVAFGRERCSSGFMSDVSTADRRLRFLIIRMCPPSEFPRVLENQARPEVRPAWRETFRNRHEFDLLPPAESAGRTDLRNLPRTSSKSGPSTSVVERLSRNVPGARTDLERSIPPPPDRNGSVPPASKSRYTPRDAPKVEPASASLGQNIDRRQRSRSDEYQLPAPPPRRERAESREASARWADPGNDVVEPQHRGARAGVAEPVTAAAISARHNSLQSTAAAGVAAGGGRHPGSAFLRDAAAAAAASVVPRVRPRSASGNIIDVEGEDVVMLPHTDSRKRPRTLDVPPVQQPPGPPGVQEAAAMSRPPGGLDIESMADAAVRKYLAGQQSLSTGLNSSVMSLVEQVVQSKLQNLFNSKVEEIIGRSSMTASIAPSPRDAGAAASAVSNGLLQPLGSRPVSRSAYAYPDEPPHATAAHQRGEPVDDYEPAVADQQRSSRRRRYTEGSDLLADKGGYSGRASMPASRVREVDVDDDWPPHGQQHTEPRSRRSEELAYPSIPDRDPVDRAADRSAEARPSQWRHSTYHDAPLLRQSSPSAAPDGADPHDRDSAAYARAPRRVLARTASPPSRKRVPSQPPYPSTYADPPGVPSQYEQGPHGTSRDRDLRTRQRSPSYAGKPHREHLQAEDDGDDRPWRSARGRSQPPRDDLSRNHRGSEDRLPRRGDERKSAFADLPSRHAPPERDERKAHRAASRSFAASDLAPSASKAAAPPLPLDPPMALQLRSGGSRVAHPKRMFPNARPLIKEMEDAFAISDFCFCVADGFEGRASDDPVRPLPDFNSGRFATEVTNIAAHMMAAQLTKYVAAEGKGVPLMDPVLLLQQACNMAEPTGAAAIILGSLNPLTGEMSIGKVGDVGYLVLRPPPPGSQMDAVKDLEVLSTWRPFINIDHKKDIFSSKLAVSQDLSTLLPAASWKHDSHSASFHLRPGDIVIAGTDGFFDAIHVVGAKGLSLRQEIRHKYFELQTDPGKLAEELLLMAYHKVQESRKVAVEEVDTPFALEAARRAQLGEAPLRIMPEDDIAVVVSYVLQAM